MDDTPDLDIGCQEVTVKYKRSKKREIRSKKLKKLLDILRSGKERHVIQYSNEEKTEFEVKLVDKKNKKLWRERDISLFLALDAVSPKPRNQKNLAEATKNRFKASMTKFISAGYLKYLGSRRILKTVVYKRYRILKDFFIGDETEGYSQQSNGSESKESSEDIPSMGSSPDSSCSFPSTSHYSCLSRRSLERDEFENICYDNEGSISIVPVVSKEIEVKDCIVDEDINFSIGMQYGNEPNSEEYQNIFNGNEGSVNILHETSEEVAVKDYTAGEISNLSIEMQDVNKPSWNSEDYQNIPNGKEESINILHEANTAVANCNSDERENISYGSEESVNILVVMNLVAKGYMSGEASNLLIGMQYVNKPNGNSDEYKGTSNGNEKSVNILPVANEVAMKDYIADESLNLSIGMPDQNNEEYQNIPNEYEESINILHGASDAVANWNNEEYQNIPNEYEESINILHGTNDVVAQSEKCRELDWSPTKSNFEDATLFGEIDHDEEILKDSTNPLLSSAVVSEGKTGLISDSNWQNEYKIFSFDEEMYDST